MNILEVCLSPDLGGLELYTFRSAFALNDINKVSGILNPQGKLKNYFDDNHLDWSGLRVGFNPLPLVSAWILAKLIDARKIDVMHVHWGKDLPLVVLAKVLSIRKPRLVYTRQMQITRNKDDVYHNFIYKNIDLILTITSRLEKDVKKYLSKNFRHKVKTLYYGVEEPSEFINNKKREELRNKLGIKKGVFLAGIFGRIKYAKGQHLVVEAINELRSKGENVQCLIVGNAMEASYLTQFKENIKKTGQDSSIYFKNFVDNPQEWMQVCDVVILASYGETFGLVLAEAMSAGVAVIGANDGGVPEIIEHEKNGLLFDLGDSHDLAKKIKILIDNPVLLEQYSLEGKIKADSVFGLEQHFRRLNEFMTTAL